MLLPAPPPIRITTHRYPTPDDGAVGALTEYYAEAFAAYEKPAILDICSSWVSHFPKEIPGGYGKRTGLGMNEYELSENKQLGRTTLQRCSATVNTIAPSSHALRHQDDDAAKGLNLGQLTQSQSSL